MTHRIAQLFGDAQNKFEDQIARLEAATGHQGHDVRMLSKNTQLARSRIEELGLDAQDTTPQELYHALRARYQRDAEQFEQALGLNSASAEEKTHHSMEIVRRALDKEVVWTIKPAAIKSLLKTHAPRKTMKLLKYRSLDSMLKRADSSVILAVAHLVESSTWHAKWTKLVKAQPASVHQSSNLRFVGANLHDGATDLQIPETGTVVINSSEPPDMLGQVLRAVMAAEEMTGKDYSQHLGMVHASLRWWNANAHLVAWIDGHAVSFNIYDVARDHHASAEFHERRHQKASEKLWQGLSDDYQNLINELNPENFITQQAQVSPVMVAAEVENV